jgi:hypothetical protein
MHACHGHHQTILAVQFGHAGREWSSTSGPQYMHQQQVVLGMLRLTCASLARVLKEEKNEWMNKIKA